MAETVGIVFIHGLAKKPAPERLEELWLWGLGLNNPRPDAFPPPNTGLKLGEVIDAPFVFNYYANVFYGEDYDTELSSYYESEKGGLEAVTAERLDTLEPGLALPKGATPEERVFILKFEAELLASAALMPNDVAPRPSAPQAAREYEIASWLPGPAKEAIIKKAAMEAYYYLFNKEYVRSDGARFMVRDELRNRLLKNLRDLKEQVDHLVIVSHSMGTIVAYDVLRNCAGCPHVDTLITVGSPLGIREVQDELIAEGVDDVDFPAATLGSWINIYDPLDPVCGVDPKLANDYSEVDGKRVEDIKESNWGKWRHTITHYLAGSQFRSRLARALRVQYP
jgi:hypothetical protein